MLHSKIKFQLVHKLLPASLPLTSLLLTSLLLTSQTPLHAQSGNGTYTLVQDMLTSGGGQIGGGNPMSAQTVLGLPAGGAASNGTFRLVGSPIPGNSAGPTKPTTMEITVTGAIDDPNANVVVNDIPATLDGNTFTAQGIKLSLGPNAITAIATDRAGNTNVASVTIYLDLPQEEKTPSLSVTVTGTIDDPRATVLVNDTEAAVSAGTYSATVQLVMGLNTITAVALDPATNSNEVSIVVTVRPPGHRPPPMPTVGTFGPTIPKVTTETSVTIGGEKIAGTTIWINGQLVYTDASSLTWSATVPLVEGDNKLIIVAKDADGLSSAEVVINIVLDLEPPKLNFNPPQRTNLNPITLRGSVDDSLTTIAITGGSADEVWQDAATRDFEFKVGLILGDNHLHIKATSPLKRETDRDFTVNLGTTPTITDVAPGDGDIFYAEESHTIRITATDNEGDQIEYRLLFDGAELGAWSTNENPLFVPGSDQLGLGTLRADVRDEVDKLDNAGVSNPQDLKVWVVRPPIRHPQDGQ